MVALILVAQVFGVVGTVPGTADEVFTDVGLSVAGLGIGEAHGTFHLDGLVQFVRGLQEGAETVEAVVREGTGAVLLGDGSVDGALLVATGQRDVGVGVEAHVIGVYEVVGFGFVGTDSTVVPFHVLHSGERKTEGATVGAIGVVNLLEGENVGGAVHPDVGAVGVPTGGGVLVFTVTGKQTFTEDIVEGGAGSHLVEAEGLGEADAQAAGTTTALGGDDHGAVQTAGTVQGGSGSTFQHGDGGEVVRVQVLELVTIVQVVGIPVGGGVGDVVVQDDAVYHEDGLVVLAQGGSTTDEDLVTTEHTTIRSVDFHTGHLTLQGRYGVDQVGVQFLALELGHCITQGLGGALDTESRHDGTLQHLGVFAQDHIHGTAVPGDYLGGVADAGNLEHSALAHVGECEGTVQIGNRTILGSLHKHRSSDDRFTGCVFHSTSDRILGEGRYACSQESKGHGKSQKEIFHVHCWF